MRPVCLTFHAAVTGYGGPADDMYLTAFYHIFQGLGTVNLTK